MLDAKKYIKKFWFIESKLSDGSALLIKIDRFPFIIGRDKNCHLTLSSKSVSRRHSEIYLNNETPMLRDLQSMNGTFVNGTRIVDTAVLREEDSIAFADQHFRILSSGDSTGEDLKKTRHLIGPFKQKTFADFYHLSKREEEVLFHLLEGKSSKAIAKKLFISEGTAKNHVLKIFEKTEVHSRFALLALYNKFPLIKKKKLTWR